MLALLIAYMMTLATAVAEGLTQAQIQQAASNMTPAQLQQATANLSPEQKAKLSGLLGGGSVGSQALPGQSMAPAQNLSADEQAALAQPPQPLPPSRIEQSFTERLQEITPASISPETSVGTLQSGITAEAALPTAAVELKQFGYNLFSSANQNLFFPTADIPVPAEYVLGPGDEIRIQYFGSRNDQLALVIDRDGLVSLPDVGPIALAGMTFQNAKALLAENIRQKLTGVTASISMGQLRSIRVFVLGDVRNPGSYLVSGISTISHALFVAGGVSKYGSLRHVLLKRNGRVVREIDLYNFLLNGDTSKDMRVLPGDVVFVPPIGHTVAVAGDVVRPGIYELNHEHTVGQLLHLAGGLLSSADTELAQIDRIRVDGNRQRIDLKLDARGQALKVHSDDLMVIHAVPRISHGEVTLTGAVKRPGLYGYKRGLMLSDIIHTTDDLLPSAYTKKIEITRYTVQNGSKRIARHFQVDLGKLLHGERSADVPLMPYDVVMVRQLTDWQEHMQVNIGGEVRFPGVYAIRDGEHLSSVLARAGGFTSKACLRAAVFTRASIKQQQQKQIDDMATRIQAEIAQQEGVLTNVTDSKLLAERQAGLEAAKRVLVQMQQVRATGRLVIHLKDIAQLKGTDFDLTLRDGDSLYVPQKPDEVMVIGQVYNNTALLYQKNLSRDDYIARSGGPTRMADTDHIYIVRANGMVDSYDGWHKKPIGPGDVIVVPEKLQVFDPLSSALDWSKVLYQVGVAIASMKVIGIL